MAIFRRLQSSDFTYLLMQLLFVTPKQRHSLALYTANSKLTVIAVQYVHILYRHFRIKLLHRVPKKKRSP